MRFCGYTSGAQEITILIQEKCLYARRALGRLKRVKLKFKCNTVTKYFYLTIVTRSEKINVLLITSLPTQCVAQNGQRERKH